MADYFGDLQFIGETIPKRRWDYTLIAPVSRPIYANVPRLPRLDRQVTVEGNDRVYRFAARDVAKIDAEPAMPGIGETSPYLHVSTYASWNDVGAWYWRLVEESLTRRRRGPPDRARAGQARHDRRGPRARRLRLRREEHPVRRAGVRHSRVQAVQGHAGARAAVRRLQGQGGADDRAAARGRRPRRAGAGADAARGPPRHRARVAGDLRSRDRLRAQAGSVPGRDGRVLGGVASCRRRIRASSCCGSARAAAC